MTRAHSTTLGILVSVVLLAIAGAVVFVLRQSSEPPSRDSTHAEPHVDETSAPAAPVPIDEPESIRTAVPAGEGEAPPLPVQSVRGRVVDAAGKPIPQIDVGILVEEGEFPIVAKSDGSGSFQLPAPQLPCSIVIVDPKWTTLRRGEVTEEAPLVPALVIAAPAVSVSGIVLDPQGRPLPGARLGIRVESNSWEAESTADGTFTFARAPAVSGARLSTRLAEFETDVRTLDLPPPEQLRIVLAPVKREGPVLTGTVVRPDGTPVSGATVAFGSVRTRSDIQGRFRLVCSWFDAATPLVAAARSSSPVILAGFGARVECSPAEQPPERLVLLPGSRSQIEGRVVLANGKPAKGWRVLLADPTPLDPGGVSEDFVEGLADHPVEQRTDGTGGFEFDGLADRPYTLLAFGRDRASRVEVTVRSEPVSAGTRDVVLQAPDGSPGAAIIGRVLTKAGGPIAGARIGLGMPTSRGSRSEHVMQRGFRTHSDSDGRFEIAGAPSGFAFLVIAREGFLPMRLPLESEKARADLVVRLRDRRELSFDGSAASPRPDLLRAGTPASSWRLDSGVVGPIELDENASEIVLYRGCREIARVPLALAKEGTTSVVWQ